MIYFDVPPALLVGFVLSTVLPLLVGLVTTRVTHAGAKALLLALLSSVTGLGTEFLASLNSGEPYNIGSGILLAATSFLVAAGMHYQIWKPSGVSGKLQDVGSGKG